jgi:hypothetical protein
VSFLNGGNDCYGQEEGKEEDRQEGGKEDRQEEGGEEEDRQESGKEACQEEGGEEDRQEASLERQSFLQGHLGPRIGGALSFS